MAVIQFQDVEQLLFIEHSSLKILHVPSRTTQTIRPIEGNLYVNHITIFDHMAIISAVSDYPRLLDLTTFDITPLPYELALYECSNRMEGKIAFNGYTSDSKAFKKDDGLYPLEAPVVIYDFQKNAYREALWLHRTNPRGDWRLDKLYPSVTLYEKDRLITGYSDGTIAVWDSQRWELTHKIKYSNQYIRHIKKLPRHAGVPHNHYLINDGHLYLLNSQLKPVLICDLGRSDLVLKLIDEALDLIVAYSIYGKKIYFIDMHTLDVRFTFPIRSLIDAVVKTDGYYLVFTRGGVERFSIN